MDRALMIPGLGADSRIFKNIKLAGHTITYVDWLEPADSDTLSSYSQKLIDQYHIADGDIIIGNSLGGMLAIEIAKKIKPDKVILISSIRTVDEAPAYFSVFRNLPIYKIVPEKLIVQSRFAIRFIFGDMSDADLALFKSMLINSSPKFIKWAMHAVLQWNNKIVPDHVYVITGNKDLVFSHKKIKNATIINGGTHIMIFDRAPEINLLLREILH